MIFKIELNKILVRKFNYIIALILIIFSAISIYKIDYLSSFLEISNKDFFIAILNRFIFLVVVFLIGVNFIYSYREDYTTNVIKLFRINNLITRKTIVSIFVTTIYFSLYYLLLFVINLDIGLFINKTLINEILVDKLGLLNFELMSFLLVFLSTTIVLFIISIFNNTNIAVSLSFLYFIGSGVLADLTQHYLATNVINYSLINIFNEGFLNIKLTNIFNYNLIFAILANSIILLVLSLFVRKIKK